MHQDHPFAAAPVHKLRNGIARAVLEHAGGLGRGSPAGSRSCGPSSQDGTGRCGPGNAKLAGPARHLGWSHDREQCRAGRSGRPRRDPATGPVAGHPDRRRGQSRPRYRGRREGGRAPGVQRQPGERDDRAVLRVPGRPGQGEREAARLPGVPRDPVPARQPGPRLPAVAARVRRPAGVPEPDQGPGRPGLLHRVGRAGRGRAAVRRGGPPVRGRALRPPAAQPVRVPDRRRRTGRGQHLGSGRRPRHRRARQRHVDRGPEPAVAGPGGARGADRPVGAAVHRGRVARGGGQVRRGAPAGLRPARRRRAAGLDRRPAQRALPVAVRPGPGRHPGPLPGRRAGGRERVLRRPGRRRAGRPGHRPGRARPAVPARRVRGLRRGEGPAERGVRVHGEGLGPADRRQPPQPLGAAHHDPGGRDAGPAGADRGHRMGPFRPDDPGGPVGGRAA